jgi:serine phosphatase RsbU (regulator of sigma subunit)
MTAASSRESVAVLAGLADALVGVESSRALMLRLEDLLAGAQALPARLYLFDGDQQVFFAASGMGCDCDVPDLPLPAHGGFPARMHPLNSRGEWIGVLEVLGREPYDLTLVEQLSALLAPTLMSIHFHEALVQELREVREEVTQILGASEMLRQLDYDMLLVKILETMMSAVHAEVGAVLTQAEAGALTPRVVLGLREEHIQAMRYRDGRSLVASVLAQGKAVCLDVEGVAAELDLTGLGANLTGVLALPLVTRGTSLGVVVLANPEVEFGPTQRRLAETVCGLAAIALDNAMLVKSTLDRERMQRELDLAHSIQAQMYPARGLSTERWQVEGSARPCTETGGDYYTFLKRDGGVVAMIADVSGHGLGAALYTTMAHAIIQQQLRCGARLEPAFEALNEALFQTQSGRFMTAALVEIDADTSMFSYVSAGHNPLLWVHEGEIVWLESCGMPLGIVPVGTFPPPPPARLAPGDCLILYTDGYTEAVNAAGELYGEDRLAAIVRQGWAAGMGANDLRLLITADVDAWVAGRPYDDDLTMVVIAIAR